MAPKIEPANNMQLLRKTQPAKKAKPAKKKKSPQKAPVKMGEPVKNSKQPKKKPQLQIKEQKGKTKKTIPVKKSKIPKKEEKGKTIPVKKPKAPIKEEKGKTIPVKKPKAPKKEQKGKTTPSIKKPKTKTKHNLDKSFFCVLQDYGTSVKKSKEKEYPWIARVVHSKTKDFPHKCTAACIGPRLFVTAARCVTVLVVEYTHVKYSGVRMPVLAFVVPSNPTKQMFDDIGIIVVKATIYKGSWPSIRLTNMKRTDNDYEWLDKLQLEEAKSGTHVVVGYAKEKSTKLETVYTEYTLSSLTVVVGMSMCYKILQENKPKSPDFWVPCYHSCSVKKHYEENSLCVKYLGVLGAAVIDSTSNTLIGVATWGTRFIGATPPVGFAIPNSKNFFEDLACARKVLKNNGATADMQSLCPLPKKKPK